MRRAEGRAEGRLPAPASPRAPAHRDPRSRPRRPAPCCLPARTRAVCRGSNPPRTRGGWPAHRRWDGASSTPRRPLAAGFAAVRASQGGHELRSEVLCERHAVDVVQPACCAPRSSAPQNRPKRPWASSLKEDGPAVGRLGARVLCAEQQLQLVGARGAAPHSPPARCPSSVVLRACACTYGRCTGRTPGVGGVWGGWHRERGAAAQNALQQRSASVRKSAASAFFYCHYHSIEAVSAEADTHYPVFFLRTRVRDTTTTARLRRSEPAPPSDNNPLFTPLPGRAVLRSVATAETQAPHGIAGKQPRSNDPPNHLPKVWVCRGGSPPPRTSRRTRARALATARGRRGWPWRARAARAAACPSGRRPASASGPPPCRRTRARRRGRPRSGASLFGARRPCASA